MKHVMLTLLALAVLFQDRAPTVPAMTPWAEMSCPFDHPGPPNDLTFLPGLGALAVTDGNAHGPSFGVWINLATLNLFYVPNYDLMARSTIGSRILFKRAYRSELAVQAKHSPGMPDGWIHQFDVYIPYAQGDTWQPLEVNWPTGAIQKLQPEIVDGKPSGKFTTTPGTPFVARGVPGGKTNDWDSVKLSWNGGGYWIFKPHESGVMVLREMGNEQSDAMHVKLMYTKDRKLGEIRNFGDDVTFMSFVYNEDGLMASVNDRLGLHVDFGYAPVDDTADSPVELITASGIGDAGKVDIYHTTYSYHLWKGSALLTGVSIPSPADNGKTQATSAVFYKSGEVIKVQDAEGNSKEFTRGAGG
jgi:hypothetical protein